MNKINFLLSNKQKLGVLTIIFIIFFCVMLILPLFFVNYNPNSIIGNYLITYSKLFFLVMLIFLYFISGIFLYHIKIDSYTISIYSYRYITSFFIKKKCFDISNMILKEYIFSKKPFTLKNILILKIKTEENKFIARRFSLSLLSNKEQKKIKKVLDQILSNNE